MNRSGPLVVLCIAPATDGTAGRLARGLVEKRLAACVNIVPGLRSLYRWKGEVQDDAEVQLIIKTTAARYEQLESWLSDNHPYDVPEIIALPIAGGAKPYLDWLEEQTRASESD